MQLPPSLTRAVFPHRQTPSPTRGQLPTHKCHAGKEPKLASYGQQGHPASPQGSRPPAEAPGTGASTLVSCGPQNRSQMGRMHGPRLLYRQATPLSLA